jgi:predicted enzyme related to lactoylglutathione lyase
MAARHGRRDTALASLEKQFSSGAFLCPAGYRHAMNFNNLLIGTDNPQALIEYYTRILGDPAYKDEQFSSWQLGTGTVSVGAHSEVHGKNTVPGRLIWNIETDDVQGEFERMKGAGAIVVKEPYSFEGMPNVWIATLADPDGNYFQLMSPFDPDQMGTAS